MISKLLKSNVYPLQIIIAYCNLFIKDYLSIYTMMDMYLLIHLNEMGL